ncbi:DUF3168 domain-containing protein [Rhizobiaceae bacterium n13]|uniref:DUF3168 domain-containing protein n=1 Tax=Ferirhizobium litorale TaxID=2927786 RepID=A0AAE3QDK9_9HYPH|nr:DUF3168 domain-containing protein [Fererhizobium litorale]MDI7861264.1 DUF3168 domain-containing protein [Fererhizobium litorale]MDI7921411.1 DUF3168 domain-containing protein [Fererhizobium litorale]
MTAANELLQTIHARLAGDAAMTALIGVDGIVDGLAVRRALPCLVIGEVETRAYRTSTEPGEEHFLTIEAWSEANGSRGVQEIAGLVRDLLDDADLVLASHALVSLAHRSTRVRRRPKSRHHVAAMRFRAVTE